jgi:GTP-binding protein
MADVALVGLPNVGKSTLISRISAARPKVADYPFTTLEPHLGVVDTGTGDFVVADIPGLIEGASEGRGLGHQFLRHIERARVLAVLIDLADGAPPAAEQRRILLAELGRYRPELLDRPTVVVGTRADVAPSGDTPPDLDLRISSVTGEGLPELVGRLSDTVGEARADEPTSAAFVVHRPVPEGIRVERDDDGSLRVVGRSAERAVALSDLTNADALDYARNRLRKLGVDAALVRAGAREGDLVHIGGHTFTYELDGI